MGDFEEVETSITYCLNVSKGKLKNKQEYTFLVNIHFKPDDPSYIDKITPMPYDVGLHFSPNPVPNGFPEKIAKGLLKRINSELNLGYHATI